MTAMGEECGNFGYIINGIEGRCYLARGHTGLHRYREAPRREVEK